MASVSATITVDFISNYVGQHRICWRTGGSGPYDCSTVVNCTGGGDACSATIAITVDNETCAEVDFEGYVQAVCEPISSLSGRISFSSTFTPSPACKAWLISCDAVALKDFTIIDGGTGYDDTDTIGVTITGGGGSGATAEASSTGGIIDTITLLTPGSGYTSAPTVTIDPPSPGDQAVAVANVDTCDSFTGFDCTGAAIGVYPEDSITLGSSFNACSETTPSVPSGYTVIQNGNCLCDCNLYTFTNNDVTDTALITYQQCVDPEASPATGGFIQQSLAPGETFSDCMVTDSYVLSNVGTGGVSVGTGEACA